MAMALACAGITALLAAIYIKLWRRRSSTTPTGFGVFLGPALLLGTVTDGGPAQLLQGLAIVAVAGAVYWLDDARGLGAHIRVILSAAVGAAIAAAYLPIDEFGWWGMVFLFVGSFINVAMVNTINFQDGADLNLATFINLTGLLLFCYAPDGSEWLSPAVVCIAFTLAFMTYNVRPRTLYFGDSGSFIFACLFTIMGSAYLLRNESPPPPEAAIPAALPIIDMAFVTLLRIRIRQRFTVRHYFHLYQRLQKDRRGFFYLLPQVVSVGLSLALAWILEAAGLDRTSAVVLGTSAMALLTFLAFRYRCVTGEAGPPRQQEVAG